MKKKEPKQNGLTMKQIERYLKKAKGDKKFYWIGRRDSFKGSSRYQEWLKNKNQMRGVRKTITEIQLVITSGY